MVNPVLVEVTRGKLVESLHRGAVAVMDAGGKTVLALGDVEHPVFPRSAIKALQALPLVESGAADYYNLKPQELALACASHSGEPEHIAKVNSMLFKAGLDHTALECGCQRPIDLKASLAMAEQQEAPLATHNNCSGKHAGLLCLAGHMKVEHKGYINRDHTVQREIRSVLEQLTGASHGEDRCGTDGCSIPTYAVPLQSMALGFARFATGHGMEPKRAQAAKRLYQACVENPFYVAGSGRACTRIMQAMKGRVLAKVGAEGVYCAAIPELGLGIALKCDDGAMRAAEAMVANVIAKLMQEGDGGALHKISTQTLKNWNNIDVGMVRATQPLLEISYI